MMKPIPVKLRLLWLAQYPAWWLAPNSLTFHRIRVAYARAVSAWLKS